MFWRNAQFMDQKTIVSKVLGKKVTMNMESIAQVIDRVREGSTYLGRPPMKSMLIQRR